MNYIDEIACEIGDECGIRGVDRDENGMRLLRIYAVLALTVGVAVTWENVHDAWSAWRSDTDPKHKSIVRFVDLAPNVQALDAKYADAIRKVASRRQPAARDSLRARCDVLEQECEEWSKLCNQQHALLEAQGKVLPAAYKCGWCVKMAGGDDTAWQAAPSMTVVEVQAHTLVCPHNPLVIEIEALREMVEAGKASDHG